MAARGQLADVVFQTRERLVARPATAPLEVITEEVETSRLGGIDDACFLGMQPQAVFLDPRRNVSQGGFGRLPASTQDDESSA